MKTDKLPTETVEAFIANVTNHPADWTYCPGSVGFDRMIGEKCNVLATLTYSRGFFGIGKLRLAKVTVGTFEVDEKHFPEIAVPVFY